MRLSHLQPGDIADPASGEVGRGEDGSATLILLLLDQGAQNRALILSKLAGRQHRHGRQIDTSRRAALEQSFSSIARPLRYLRHHAARRSQIGINRPLFLAGEELLVLLQKELISALIFV